MVLTLSNGWEVRLGLKKTSLGNPFSLSPSQTGFDIDTLPMYNPIEKKLQFLKWVGFVVRENKEKDHTDNVLLAS